MVHGRNGYIRVSKMICYYIYKNFVLVLCEVHFAYYSGFSGQIYYADWLPTLFNRFFTAWPCLVAFMFERDLDYETALRNPVLYRAGQLRQYFNLKVFWQWLGYSIIHGAGTFHFIGYVSTHPFH